MITANPTRSGARAAQSEASRSAQRRKVLEPELIDAKHEERLRRIHVIARFMDDAFAIPGTRYRIGWDSLIGLVPGIGDAATALAAVWLVYEAKQLGLPRHKLLRMLANVGIDAAVGAFPVFGDVFDVAFKANRKNARIVREHFERKRPS